MSGGFVAREPSLEKNYDNWVAYFESMGAPKYRAAQMCAWLWKRAVFDVAMMTDFGKELRERMSETLDFSHPVISDASHSENDGSKKFSVKMADGASVETALLKHGPRLTACVSTQVGCPVVCPFCATGAGGFERNLTAGEIAGQFIAMERLAGREINSLVFMGMGEPFLNTGHVLEAVRRLNSPKMRGLGIRHMTISTAGIIPGIAELAQSGLGVRLAVSLHTAYEDQRDELVPCNSSYPLSELIPALRDYQRITGDRVTIEYALFKGRNDSLGHARALVRLLYGLHSFVNLISCSENGLGYERATPDATLRFKSVLESAGFESEIRASLGGDINAACGQLRSAPRAPESLRKTIAAPERAAKTGAVKTRHSGEGRPRPAPGEERRPEKSAPRGGARKGPQAAPRDAKKGGRSGHAPSHGKTGGRARARRNSGGGKPGRP